MDAKYCDQHVCVSICLCIRSYISKTTFQIPLHFLYMLPVAVARSYSDNNAICNVLPVLWMTLGIHTLAPIEQNQTPHYVCRVRQMAHRERSLVSMTVLLLCSGRGAKYCDQRVCMSAVYLFACVFVGLIAHIFKKHKLKFHQFFVHVSCDRGSVLF